MSTHHQAELDLTSHALARLDTDLLLCVVVNALIAHDDPTPLTLMRRLANIVVTMAATQDDTTKVRCVSMLRDVADLYEHALMIALEQKN